jgi:hypothetical protein
MAGCAGTHAATQGFNTIIECAQHLHEVSARFNIYIVLLTDPVCHQNFAHYGSDYLNFD